MSSDANFGIREVEVPAKSSNGNDVTINQGCADASIRSHPIKRPSHHLSQPSTSGEVGSSPKMPKKFDKSPTDVSEDSNQPSCSKSIPKKSEAGIISGFNSIRETILDHPQGQRVIDVLDSDKPFVGEDRQMMVRIIVQELTRKDVAGYYPKHETKMALAKALITEFPRLKNEYSVFGHEHYYHPQKKTGFISFRLNQVQKGLPFSEKKYRVQPSKRKDALVTNTSAKNKNTITLLSQEELEAKVSLMLGLDESEGNRQEINQLLDDTFYTRRNWVLEHGPTVTAVLKKYPRIKAFDGSMIDNEFRRMFGDKTDAFITQFPSFYEKRIMYYAKFDKSKLLKKYLSEKDESLKALLILIGLVPQPASVVLSKNKKTDGTAGKTKSKKNNEVEDSKNIGKEDENISTKKGKYEKGKLKSETVEPQDYLLKYATGATDPRVFVESLRKAGKSKIQPYLLVLGNETMPFYFVVAENAIFSRKDTTNLISAFDLLFKVFQVFNLQYPAELDYFYEFIESSVYECKECSISVIASLSVNLKNIKKVPTVEE
ncbi:hypothetical protein QAD02_010317 [Eretmocerus hayati]|uniref:Uncharacterized protein n=1 Tax=Eretmocerus hayati TaxID=131215 RepID=A0ACC2NC76_9HYME|nr:hypothetical protein QAD02_010317 [Eretmocerus hayati]